MVIGGGEGDDRTHCFGRQSRRPRFCDGAEILVDQDVATLVCPGPLRPGGCPILRKEACPIADAADGVLFHLNLDHPDHRRILAAYIRKYGDDIPIRVVVNPEQKKRWHKLLSLVEVFTEPVGSVYLDGLPPKSSTAGERANREFP